MSKIINPLYVKTIPKPKERMVATARMENSVPGVCPKCKQHMELSNLGNKQQVYFCPVCRVASPLPE